MTYEIHPKEKQQILIKKIEHYTLIYNTNTHTLTIHILFVARIAALGMQTHRSAAQTFSHEAVDPSSMRK